MTATRSYTLNADLARQVGMTSRITQSGRYVGRFTRAELIASRQKTEGVEFTFETETGQIADYLTCWTHNVEGRELYGLKVLNAILTCMRLREIAPRVAKLEDRNGGTRDARVFPQLLDKPIGLVLQREEYLKQDGNVGWKFSIVAPFEPSSGMTAAEILGRATEAAQIDRIVESLRDKPLPRRADDAARARPAYPGGLADMDEDIPF
jgi:hypothetical protein